MSMGMTNLINFDLFFFLRKNENTFLTNYEYDKNISLSFDTGEVRQGGQGGEVPQLGLSPCELWNLFEIGLRNKQIKIYMKYN